MPKSIFIPDADHNVLASDMLGYGRNPAILFHRHVAEGIYPVIGAAMDNMRPITLL